MFIIIGVIIFIFFGLILGLCVNIRCGTSEDKIPDMIFGVSLGLSVGLVVTMIISAAAAGMLGEKEAVTVNITPIYAFQDNLNIKGHRTLMSGYIDEVLYYYYVYQTTDGGYKVGHVKQDDATIYYTANEEDCRLETREMHFKNPIHDWLAEGFIDENTSYAFYIPEGSIITEYNVDLQ